MDEFTLSVQPYSISAISPNFFISQPFSYYLLIFQFFKDFKDKQDSFRPMVIEVIFVL